jgi:hypothetical protein
MAPVRGSDSCDIACVARRCEPVVNRGPDAPTLDRRLAGTMVPRDQQNHPIAASDRLLKAAVDRGPGGVETHSVEIEHSVGLDGAAA